MKKSRSHRNSAAVHPVAIALRRAGPVPAELVTGLRLREWSAIESFAKRNATLTELAMLRELLGMCSCSIDLGFGPEAQPACLAAAAILGSFDTAQNPEALLGMNDSQIEVMRELQGYHDLQRAAFTWGDYLQVIELATVMLRSVSPSISEKSPG